MAHIIERDSGYFEDLERPIPHRSSLFNIDYNHARWLLGPAAETQEVSERPISNPPMGGFVSIHYQLVRCGFRFPIFPFLKTFLNYYGLVPGSWCPTRIAC